MNQLINFNFQGNKVRTVQISNEPYFVGKDVAEILGYQNGSRDINRHVDEEDRQNYQNGTFESPRGLTVINESGLYSLILSSKMPNAKQFKHWVTSEVLPSIRKHGAYMTPETLQETLAQPENMIQILTALKNEQDAHKKLQQENNKMKPHAILGAVVENSVNSISVKALATILKEKGVNIGQNRLFQWLRENGYLISRYGHSRNYPTQRSMNMGLFELKPNPIVHNSGEMETRYTPLVTGKGQKYFINKFFSEKVLEA
ncbi:phage repressor protein/antirepressor Ant [Liquorilactobacillus mali]|uniref:phage repressor protein/antirepressor Ant n=3 Tax=Liquorilactobacillus mali TaxID=1618 RepID=UPI000249144E|nr:phage repressor protein/antirepressor Ant [Liquorilactobacillus mali]EJE98225.1 phage antirepressor protein [Liquorilactobacillus mali KCTC 3596 = DSM 20444]MDC7953568.1 phage repressor protein/antirepressor Ant [Liquorilactobacillus mali]QFQ75006.1 phage repressor protein/antirepressor Ant [Liquorilactobacillus mali]